MAPTTTSIFALFVATAAVALVNSEGACDPKRLSGTVRNVLNRAGTPIANAARLSDGNSNTGAGFSCDQLPVTIEFDIPEDMHIETVSINSDWWSKRPKLSVMEAELHNETVWHPVSFGVHENDKNTACGDGITTFGGFKCCPGFQNCAGKGGSFLNFSVSVIASRLRMNVTDGYCNGNSMIIKEILLFGNSPECQDECPNDCSGSDRGTCTPYAVDGIPINFQKEGVDHSQFVCVCRPGWSGPDCSVAANCDDHGYDYCEANDKSEVNGANCSAQEDSAHVAVAHWDTDSCGAGAEGDTIDQCLLDSNIVEKLTNNQMSTTKENFENEILFKTALGADDDLGFEITTTTSCCASGKMRLISNELKSSLCYKWFLAFQCVPDCVDSCCAVTTTTSSTTTMTTTTTITTTTMTTSTTTATMTTTTTTMTTMTKTTTYTTTLTTTTMTTTTTETTTTSSTGSSTTTVSTVTTVTVSSTTFTTITTTVVGGDDDSKTTEDPKNGGDTAGSTADDNNTNTIALSLIVAVVLIVIAILIAVIIIKRARNGNASSAHTVSFENPMYDSHDVSGSAAAGSAYTDPTDGTMDGGYQDVSGAGAGTGYMDVGPSEDFYADDADDV